MGRRSHRRPGVRGVYFHTIPFSVNLGGGLPASLSSFVRVVSLMGAARMKDVLVLAAEEMAATAVA